MTASFAGLLLGKGDPETVFKMSPSEVYWHVQQMPLGLLASESTHTAGEHCPPKCPGRRNGRNK